MIILRIPPTHLSITPRFQPFTLCVCGSRFVFLVYYTVARMSSFLGQCERLSMRLVELFLTVRVLKRVAKKFHQIFFIVCINF
jgi:hypothetical protein